MKLWTKFKLALFAGLTVTMMWHWQVTEADAYVLEKTDGIPWAIVPGDTPATPSGAEAAPMVEPVPSGHWESAGRHKITHYCPLECCNGKGNAWKTASGAPMVIGKTVAASSREFPFGTRLLINGNIYVVEDRGVGRGCIDILVDSDLVANQLGKYYTTVHVWRED